MASASHKRRSICKKNAHIFPSLEKMSDARTSLLEKKAPNISSYFCRFFHRFPENIFPGSCKRGVEQYGYLFIQIVKMHHGPHRKHDIKFHAILLRALFHKFL